MPQGYVGGFQLPPDHPLYQAYLSTPDWAKQQFALDARSGMTLEQIQNRLGGLVQQSARSGNLAATQALSGTGGAGGAPSFGFGIRPGGGAPANPQAALGASLGIGGGGQFGGAGAGQFGGATNLINQQQSSLDAANQANERRYQEILAGEQARLGELRGGYQQLLAEQARRGGQEAADIRQEFRGQQSQAMQSLVDRGMAGSTIGASLRGGFAREETSALGRLQERLRGERMGIQQQQLGAETALSGERLRFQERKEETGPDQGAFMSVLQQLAQAGQLGGGGSPYGAAAPAFDAPRRRLFNAPVQAAQVGLVPQAAFRPAPTQPVQSYVPIAQRERAAARNQKAEDARAKRIARRAGVKG